MASGPAATGSPSAIHSTASSACCWDTPKRSRSANCQGDTSADVGIRRSMKWARLVQKAQSPS
jgi:hypothetical protein